MKLVGAFEDQEDEGLFPSTKRGGKESAAPRTSSGAAHDRGEAFKLAHGSASARPVLADDEPVNFFAQFSIDDDDDDDPAPAPTKRSSQGPSSPPSQEQAMTAQQPAQPLPSDTVLQTLPLCSKDKVSSLIQAASAHPGMESAESPTDLTNIPASPPATVAIDKTMPAIEPCEPCGAGLVDNNPKLPRGIMRSNTSAVDDVSMPVALVASQEVCPAVAPASDVCNSGTVITGVATTATTAQPDTITADVHSSKTVQAVEDGKSEAVLMEVGEADVVGEGRFSFGFAAKQFSASQGGPSSPASMPLFSLVASAGCTMTTPSAVDTTSQQTLVEDSAANTDIPHATPLANKRAAGLTSDKAPKEAPGYCESQEGPRSIAADVTVPDSNNPCIEGSSNAPLTPKAHDSLGPATTNVISNGNGGQALLDSPVSGMVRTSHHQVTPQPPVCILGAPASMVTDTLPDISMASDTASAKTCTAPAAAVCSMHQRALGATAASATKAAAIAIPAAACAPSGAAFPSTLQAAAAGSSLVVQASSLKAVAAMAQARQTAAAMDVDMPRGSGHANSTDKQGNMKGPTERGSGSLIQKPCVPHSHGMQAGKVATVNSTSKRALPDAWVQQQQAVAPRASGSKQPRTSTASHMHHKQQADAPPPSATIAVVLGSAVDVSAAVATSPTAVPNVGPAPKTPVTAVASNTALLTNPASSPAAGRTMITTSGTTGPHAASCLLSADSTAPSLKTTGPLAGSAATGIVCGAAGATAAVDTDAASTPMTSFAGNAADGIVKLPTVAGAKLHAGEAAINKPVSAAIAIPDAAAVPALVATSTVAAANDAGMLEPNNATLAAGNTMNIGRLNGAVGNVTSTNSAYGNVTTNPVYGMSSPSACGEPLLPSELLDRSGAMQKLEMMLLQARSLQVQVAEARTQSAALRNRLLRLDNPLMRLRLAQAGAWQAAAGAAAAITTDTHA